MEKVKPWLLDENPKVREFTQKYIDYLKERIEFERKRADEEIILRKHLYGEDNEPVEE
jgi:hypothetical protein